MEEVTKRERNNKTVFLFTSRTFQGTGFKSVKLLLKIRSFAQAKYINHRTNKEVISTNMYLTLRLLIN